MRHRLLGHDTVGQISWQQPARPGKGMQGRGMIANAGARYVHIYMCIYIYISLSLSVYISTHPREPRLGSFQVREDTAELSPKKESAFPLSIGLLTQGDVVTVCDNHVQLLTEATTLLLITTASRAGSDTLDNIDKSED